MADLAQLVRALVCGTRCREFESHNPPHTKRPAFERVFVYGINKQGSNSRKSEFDYKRKRGGSIAVGKADERSERADTKCYAK